MIDGDGEEVGFPPPNRGLDVIDAGLPNRPPVVAGTGLEPEHAPDVELAKPAKGLEEGVAEPNALLGVTTGLRMGPLAPGMLPQKRLGPETGPGEWNELEVVVVVG